jgi:hypothetical protein
MHLISNIIVPLVIVLLITPRIASRPPILNLIYFGLSIFYYIEHLSTVHVN